MFLVHGAVVSQVWLKVLERFGQASHPSAESPLLFSLRSELRLLLRLPRRTATPVMPVTLIAASQADVSTAAPWASALAARLAAVAAAALPFYHLRTETATEQEITNHESPLTTLSGNTWAFNVSTI